MARGLLWLSFLALGVGFVLSRSTGPPLVTDVCNSVRPAVFPNSPHNQRSGNGDYFVSTDIPVSMTPGSYNYTAGQTYTVQVQSRSANIFKGFLVQSQDPSGTTVGTFATTNSVQQVLACQTSFPSITLGSTIAHNSAGSYSSQTFNWTAPNSDGLVNFIYSVVRVRADYFGPLSAAVETIAAKTTNAPTTLTAPTRMPNDYRTILRSPDNCAVSDCTVFVGIEQNEENKEYLDVYMEATAQAWVAVGFSDTASMFDADVLACNYNLVTDMVEALDTWNLSPPTRNNILDNVQDISLFSGSFANGRITCTLARKTAGSDVPTQDLNLDAKYYLLYGRGMTRSAGSLLTHGTTNVPQISTGKINVVDNAAISGTTPLLLALIVATCIAMFFKV